MANRRGATDDEFRDWGGYSRLASANRRPVVGSMLVLQLSLPAMLMFLVANEFATQGQDPLSKVLYVCVAYDR